ncbi:MAG: hypothetical protein KDA33_11815 [Phycisphaerales bacterium]|nr:hypothetical protein [Phycisphaerales bacterium]
MIVEWTGLTNCPNCAYDIHLGLPNDRCPECGLSLDDVTRIFKSSWPAREMARGCALPALLFFTLGPAAVTLMAIGLPQAVVVAMVPIGAIALLALFVWRIVRSRRDAPLLITSRNGLAIGPEGRMRILAWREIQGVNLVDWPRHVRTTDGETIVISQSLDSENDVRIFEAMVQALRDAAENADTMAPILRRDDIDALALPVAAPAKRAGAAPLVSIAIIVISGIVGIIVGQFHEAAGAMVFGLTNWAVAIYWLRKSWKSDRAEAKSLTNTPSSADEGPE